MVCPSPLFLAQARQEAQVLDVSIVNSVAKLFPGSQEILNGKGLPTRVVQVGVAIVKPCLIRINCAPTAGQDQGEGFTNLYSF